MHGRPGDIFEGCRFLAFLIDQKKADLIFCDENQMRVFFPNLCETRL